MTLERYAVSEILSLPTEGMTGRRKIKTSVKEITIDNVKEVFQKALAIHAMNAAEITYLWEYYKGSQDVRFKKKYVRENINNKVTVNIANEIVTFKTSYLLNEPISWLVYMTAPSTGKAVDKEEAKGSGYVPLGFLKHFYRKAYRVLRRHLPEEKTIVFHDGFRFMSWRGFFLFSSMKNVALDTHIYIFAMESFVPIARPWVYRMYIGIHRHQIRRVQKVVPVIVGEWCICNKYANRMDQSVMSQKDRAEKQKAKYRQIARMGMRRSNAR